MDRMDRMETLFSACKKSRQAVPAKALLESQQAKKEGAEKIFFRTLSGMALNKTVKAYGSRLLGDIPCRVHIFQRGVSRATSGACCRTCSSRAVSLR